MAISLLYDLTVRAIIIIALTDAIIFYLMSKNHVKIMRFLQKIRLWRTDVLGHCCYVGAAPP